MFNMCPYGNLLVQLERGIFLKNSILESTPCSQNIGEWANQMVPSKKKKQTVGVPLATLLIEA